MEARIHRAPPVPHRRLILLLLAEQALISDWRSEILGRGLNHLFGAARTGSLIILFLGLSETSELPRVQRSIRAILLAISDQTAHDRRRLRRLYIGF